MYNINKGYAFNIYTYKFINKTRHSSLLKAQIRITSCTCLTPYAPMDSSFWFDTINLGWFIVYIKGSQVIISK